MSDPTDKASVAGELLTRLWIQSDNYSDGFGPLCMEAAEEITRLQAELKRALSPPHGDVQMALALEDMAREFQGRNKTESPAARLLFHAARVIRGTPAQSDGMESIADNKIIPRQIGSPYFKNDYEGDGMRDALVDLDTPLPNGWHINGKRMTEDDEYFLLDGKGNGIAQFVSREVAQQFFALASHPDRRPGMTDERRAIRRTASEGTYDELAIRKAVCFELAEMIVAEHATIKRASQRQ